VETANFSAVGILDMATLKVRLIFVNYDGKPVDVSAPVCVTGTSRLYYLGELALQGFEETHFVRELALELCGSHGSGPLAVIRER
jgi:hypothetical protein